MKTQMLSFRSLLFKSLPLIAMVMLLTGCCWLGFTCYDLFIYGDQDLEKSQIYLDNRLIEESTIRATGTGSVEINAPYGKHEIKIVKKGFRPFVAILNYEGGRREKSLEVTFKRLDSPEPVDTLYQGDVEL